MNIPAFYFINLMFAWLGVNFLLCFRHVLRLNDHPELPFEDYEYNLLQKFLEYTFFLPSTYFWKFLDRYETMVVKEWHSVETIRKLKE